MDARKIQKEAMDSSKRCRILSRSNAGGFEVSSRGRSPVKAVEKPPNCGFQSSDMNHTSTKNDNQGWTFEDYSDYEKLLVAGIGAGSEHLKKPQGTPRENLPREEREVKGQITDQKKTRNGKQSRRCPDGLIQVHPRGKKMKNVTTLTSPVTDFCGTWMSRDNAWPVVSSRPAIPQKCGSAARISEIGEPFSVLKEFGQNDMGSPLYAKPATELVDYTFTATSVRDGMRRDDSAFMFDGQQKIRPETDSDMDSGPSHNNEIYGCFDDSVHTKVGSYTRLALFHFHSGSEDPETSDYYQKGRYWAQSDVNFPSLHALNVGKQACSHPTPDSSPVNYNPVHAERRNVPASHGYITAIPEAHRLDAAKSPYSENRAETKTQHAAITGCEENIHGSRKGGKAPDETNVGVARGQAGDSKAETGAENAQRNDKRDQQQSVLEDTYSKILESSTGSRDITKDESRANPSPPKDLKPEQTNHKQEEDKQDHISLSDWSCPKPQFSKEHGSEVSSKDEGRDSLPVDDQCGYETSSRVAQEANELDGRLKPPDKEQTLPPADTEDCAKYRTSQETTGKPGHSNKSEEKPDDEADTDSFDSRSRHLLQQLKMVQVAKRKASVLLRRVQNIVDRSALPGESFGHSEDMKKGCKSAERSQVDRYKHKHRMAKPAQDHADPHPRHSSSVAVKDEKSGKHRDQTSHEAEARSPKHEAFHTKEIMKSVVTMLDKHNRATSKERGDDSSIHVSGTKSFKTSKHKPGVKVSPRVTTARKNTPDRKGQKLPNSHLHKPANAKRQDISAPQGGFELYSTQESSTGKPNSHTEANFPVIVSDRTQNSPKFDNFQEIALPMSIFRSARTRKDFLKSASFTSESGNSMCTYDFNHFMCKNDRKLKAKCTKSNRRRRATSEPRGVRDSHTLNRSTSPDTFTYKNTLVRQNRNKLSKSSMKQSLKTAINVAQRSISAAAKVAEALNFVRLANNDSISSSSTTLEEDIPQSLHKKHGHSSPISKSLCMNNILLERASCRLPSETLPEPAVKSKQVDQFIINEPARSGDRCPAKTDKSKRSSPVKSRVQDGSPVHRMPVCSPARKDQLSRSRFECDRHVTDRMTAPDSLVHTESSSVVWACSSKPTKCAPDQSVVVASLPNQSGMPTSPQFTVQIVYAKPQEKPRKPEVNCLIECSFPRKPAPGTCMESGHREVKMGKPGDLCTSDMNEKRAERQHRRITPSRKSGGHEDKPWTTKQKAEHEQSPEFCFHEESSCCGSFHENSIKCLHAPARNDQGLQEFSLPSRKGIRRQIINCCVDSTVTDSVGSETAKSNANFNRSVIGPLSPGTELTIFHKQEETRLNKFCISKVTKELNLSQSADLIMVWKQDVSFQHENGICSCQLDQFQSMNSVRFSSGHLGPSLSNGWQSQSEEKCPQAMACRAKCHPLQQYETEVAPVGDSFQGRQTEVAPVGDSFQGRQTEVAHVGDSFQGRQTEVAHVGDSFKGTGGGKQSHQYVASLCYCDSSSPPISSDDLSYGESFASELCRT